MNKEEHEKVLPPLPMPFIKLQGRNSRTKAQSEMMELFSVDQMREYALAAIMRKEPEPPTVKESLTVPVVKQSLTTEPISDAEIFDIAGNYDCGTNGENMEWTFKSQKELLDFARALLEKAR